MREPERAGKKGGAKAAQPVPPEEATPCGLCGDPLIEGESGSWEPRGLYHVGCIREARRETLKGPGRGSYENRGSRPRKRRS